MIFRVLAVVLALCFITGSAQADKSAQRSFKNWQHVAQVGQIPSWPPVQPPPSGGGGVTFTADAAPAVATGIGFGSSIAFTSVAIGGSGTGVIVVAVGQDYTGAAISSVIASSCTGTTPTFSLLTNDTDFHISLFKTASTAALGQMCTLTVNGTGLDEIGIIVGHYTGATTVGTPGLLQVAGSGANPQDITATITSGGIGVAVIGVAAGSTSCTGITWTNTTASGGDFCIFTTVGNGMLMAMAHTTATGSQTVGVSATNIGFSTAGILNGWSP